VVGLELKREFVAGDLRDPRRAALPIAAAIGGMTLPAGLFVLLWALLPLVAFAFLVQRRIQSSWLLVPLAVTCGPLCTPPVSMPPSLACCSGSQFRC
jgi:Na+/H+ antiporter 1